MGTPASRRSQVTPPVCIPTSAPKPEQLSVPPRGVTVAGPACIAWANSEARAHFSQTQSALNVPAF